MRLVHRNSSAMGRAGRSSSSETHILLLALAGATLRSSTCTAFLTPARQLEGIATTSARSAVSSRTALGMAVGLGPKKSETSQQQSTIGEGDQETDIMTAEVAASAPSVILDEYGNPAHIILDNEPYREKRMSNSDRAVDKWFGAILGEGELGSSHLGSISAEARERLLTKVELKDEPIRVMDDEEWTPYVTRRLPTSPLFPVYGLETFGLPTPRRGAEAWRQFDVNGLTANDYSDVPDGIGTDMEISQEEADGMIATFQSKGAWVDDASCRGRLVYVDGRFCPLLSKETDVAKNLHSSDFADDGVVDERLRSFLSRLPDGFTDELAAEVPDDESTPHTSLKKLSGPDHCVGEATSQFAVNNQQGAAAFVALNSVRAGCVALVETEEGNEDAEETAKPVLIINARSPSAGKGRSDGGSGDNGKGVTMHPRTLAIAGDGSVLSLVQVSVDVNDDSEDKPCPTFTNGCTQVYVGSKANVTHTSLEESGGTVTSNVEITTEEMDAARLAFRPADVETNPEEKTSSKTPIFLENPREVEAARPALRDTHFEVIDAYVTGDDGSYTAAIMDLGGCGRSRVCVSVSLLRPRSSTSVNGFSLSGGTQRSDMRTSIQHVAQGTVSRQEQRNMVGGRSTASFKGRIRVEQSAQQTDSEQLSRTILLSDHARIWATPSLEIIADDVTCTHGATVSDLSDEEMFYLRSRGIDRKMARSILMYAFVNEIEQIVDPTIAGDYNDERGLRSRVTRRLQNLVPMGEKTLVGGEFQSV